MTVLDNLVFPTIAGLVALLLGAGILWLIRSIGQVLREIADVSHEVHLNSGTSVKDVVVGLRDSHVEMSKLLKRMEKRQRKMELAQIEMRTKIAA